MWYGNINVWKHGTIHAENVNKCQETQILALAQIAQVMSPNLYVYFYNMLRSCASCIWPVLLPDRNCFCHLSPEEFKLALDFLMKKFAQLLPTTARADNQFINISNPDPFTLLKLISTKYVFPNHVHKFQSLSNFSASQIWWNQPPNLFGWKKKLFHSKLSWWRIYWVNVNWKYRFSVSLVALSLIFVLENSKADPEA